MVSAIVGLEPIKNEMDNNMTGNGKEKVKENESSAGTTTTTISTIAVRAEPHSTVVVALLKSIGYVDLRIDKMRPGLLEIGSTPEENAQLLLIHTDLFQRLLGKQQQVEELLGRAEQLVHEQTEPGDVMVYEAMADGLAAAWKGLSRQLEMRGYILMDSQKLYALALKHEELSKILNSRLQVEEQPKGSKEKAQQIVNELAELTSDGMAIGSNLITQIRVLGSLADNADRPREVFEACLDIEKIMLKMAESWELLEGEWRHLNPKDEKEESDNLVQTQFQKKSGQMDTNLEMAEKCLKEAQKKFEKIKREEEKRQKVGEMGKCIKELQTLLDETKTNQSSLQQLAERIYAKCTELPPEMSTKCADLLERYNRLWKEVQNRLELLEKSLQWIKDADGLLTQLAKMRRELGSADEAMAGELGPLAQQKGLALIEQGEQLVAQWNDVEGGGKGLRGEMAEKVHKLKGEVIEVVHLARERIAAGKAQKLGEKIILLEQWIQKMANPFIQKRISLNPFAPEIAEFVSIHRKFGADLTDKEQQSQSIQSQQKLLAQNEVERLGIVQKRMSQLRKMLEIRMQLGKKMEQLQKLSRELETSFHFLSTLLQQNELGNQKNTEQQVRHLLQNLNENCIQEKHQSDNFQVIATECQGNDPNLGLIEALGWSRAQITSHRQQFNSLNEQCRIWEQNRKERTNGRPPKFVMTLPDEKLIWEGQKLELVAKIDGDPEPKIYWLKDGKELRERTGQCRIGWLNGMATLIIEEVVAEDEGEYSLKAENVNGCAEGKIILIVKGKEGEKILHQQKTTTTRKIVTLNGDKLVEELGEFKPRFVKQLENVSVREGEQFQLDCLVVGNPEPKIIWFREEQTVRESDRIHLSFKGDHCTLNCTNAGNEDAGLYKVLAVNVHGETINFCRVVIIPPSPKRKIPPPTPPKPSTPVEMIMKNARMEQQQKHQKELIGEIVEKKAAIPPRLEPQLSSQIVREGQTVIFQTFISGSPSPKVKWFYNGKQIQIERPDLGLSRDEDGKCTLTIPCVLLEHAGQYGLEANNEFGQATSSATLNVLLDIGGPTNAFGMQIGDGEEEINMMKKTEQKLITTRTISGHQQQQFIVQQNQELPNGGSHQESYFSQWTTESPTQGPIYSVSKSERAESRRTSSDLGDPGYSSLANAPECLRPFPTEISINEGERTEVDCLILGNPRPKVQWFFNERPIKSSPNFVEFINIGDTYAIRFNPARLENAGWYRLVAENIRGRNESLTLIHVRPKSMIPKPAFGQQKGRRSIGGVQGLLNWQKQKLLQQQQTRALSTPPRPPNYYATQTPPPTSVNKKVEQMPQIMSMSAYQPREEDAQSGMFHNGHPLVESHSEHRFISTDELLLTKTERASPPCQKGSPPHFMQTLVSVVLNEGQSARFEAVVTGLPPPKLEWTKNGQPLLGNDKKIRIWTEGGRAILTINQIDADDAGKYCCMAENASGMASSSAQLVLRPETMAPDFVERLVSEEVEEGSFLKWTVRASGEPEPTVCWLRDGQLILEVEGASMKKEGPFVYSLLIGNVQLEDAGQFTCILENNAGEARSTADLVVRPKGAAPGKYVHVTKVTQEKQIKGDELARNETVTIDSQLMEGERGEGNKEEEEEEELEEEEE